VAPDAACPPTPESCVEWEPRDLDRRAQERLRDRQHSACAPDRPEPRALRNSGRHLRYRRPQNLIDSLSAAATAGTFFWCKQYGALPAADSGRADRPRSQTFAGNRLGAAPSTSPACTSEAAGAHPVPPGLPIRHQPGERRTRTGGGGPRTIGPPRRDAPILRRVANADTRTCATTDWVVPPPQRRWQETHR
jgi:hypothetical protein